MGYEAAPSGGHAALQVGAALPPYHPDNISFLLKTSDPGNSSKAARILGDLRTALQAAKKASTLGGWAGRVTSSVRPSGPEDPPPPPAGGMVWTAGVLSANVVPEVCPSKGARIPHTPLPVDDGEDLAGLLATGVPGLSEAAAFQLLFLLDVERTRQADGEAFDEAGVHLMHAVRFRKASLQYAAKAKGQGAMGDAMKTLPWHTVVWGVHSDSTDSLLQGTVALYKDQLSWGDVIHLRIPLWLASNALLRSLCEKQANALFQKQRDPRDAALLYCAMGKKAILVQLFKMVSEPRLSDFFARDFTQSNHQAAASKNALSALSKGNTCFAAAFFILAGRAMDAADIIVQRTGDWVLAYTVLRLIDDAPLLGPLCKAFLEAQEEKIVGGDPYLQHIVHWKLGRYEASLAPILGVRSGYSGLYELASQIINRPQLRVAEAALFPAARKCVLLLHLIQVHLERGRVSIALYCWHMFQHWAAAAEADRKAGGWKAAKKHQEEAEKEKAAIDSGTMDFSAFGMFAAPQPPAPAPAEETAADAAADDDDDEDDPSAPPQLNDVYVAAVRERLCFVVLSVHVADTVAALSALAANVADGCEAAAERWRAAVRDTGDLLRDMCEQTCQSPRGVLEALEREQEQRGAVLGAALVAAAGEGLEGGEAPETVPPSVLGLCLESLRSVTSVATRGEVACGVRAPWDSARQRAAANQIVALACSGAYPTAPAARILLCTLAVQLLALAWAERDAAMLAALMQCPVDLKQPLSSWVAKVLAAKGVHEEATLSAWADARQEEAMGCGPAFAELTRAQAGHCRLLGSLAGLCCCSMYRTTLQVGGSGDEGRVLAEAYTALAGLGRRFEGEVSGTAHTRMRGFSVLDAACATHYPTTVAKLVAREVALDRAVDAAHRGKLQAGAEQSYASWQYELGRVLKTNPALGAVLSMASPLPLQGSNAVAPPATRGYAAYHVVAVDAANGGGDRRSQGRPGGAATHAHDDDDAAAAAFDEVYKVRKGGIHSVCVYPDGQLVVCHQRGISEAAVNTITDTASPPLHASPPHGTEDDRAERARSIANHPTLPLYVSGGGDVVQLYNTGVPTPLATFRGTRDGAIQRVKVSWGGSLVAACDNKGHLMTWRLETGVQTGETRIMASAVYKDTCADVFFLDDATLVGTIGWNRSQPPQLLLHDLMFSRKGGHPGVAAVTLPTDMEPTVAVALRPSRDVLVCGRSGEVCLYDLRSLRRPVYHSKIHDRSIRAVGINPHNNHAALGTSGGDLLMLHPSKGLDPLAVVENVHTTSKNPFSFDGSNATTPGVTSVVYDDGWWYTSGSDGRVCRRAVHHDER